MNGLMRVHVYNNKIFILFGMKKSKISGKDKRNFCFQQNFSGCLKKILWVILIIEISGQVQSL